MRVAGGNRAQPSDAQRLRLYRDREAGRDPGRLLDVPILAPGRHADISSGIPSFGGSPAGARS